MDTTHMASMTPKATVIVPRLSEKAYGLSQAKNVYVFDIPTGVNKHTVARAVEAQYEVQVTAVNIANIEGKVKRTVRRSGRAVSGRQNAVRKAYVTVKAGQTLPIFAGIEQAAAKEEAINDKVAAEMAKQAKKADKESKESK